MWPPLPSNAVALKWTTSPVRASAEVGSTVNLRIVSRTTCSFTVPLTSPETALMVTVPDATPVTNPAVSTVAVAGFSEVQWIATSVLGVPLAVRTMAVSFSALPIARVG
jgi:hypothetical protein